MMYIEAQEVSKSFGQALVLNDLSFTLERGQVLSVIGPSGSGKSTMLRCLNGLVQVDSGNIRLLDGEFQINRQTSATPSLRTKVGMVFQQPNLWPDKSVLENVILAPMQVLKVPKSQAIELAKVMLTKVGVLDKASRMIHTLSGGEAQRVAIARAMVMNPQILLLDEVTSALDPELIWEVLEVIRSVVATGTTVVMATHQIKFAKQITNQVIFLDRGQVVEQGSVTAVLGNPSHPRTQEFLRRILAGQL